MSNDKKSDPLNPDEQEILYEKLSMDDDSFETLQFIRKSMKSLLKKENGRQDNRSDQEKLD